jgi:hypothetical protein
VIVANVEIRLMQKPPESKTESGPLR